MYDRLCMIDYVHYVHVLNALDMHARAHTQFYNFRYSFYKHWYKRVGHYLIFVSYS